MDKTIIRINDVKVWFPRTKGFPKRIVGYVKAVDGISFDIYRGETVGIVGESGCGKTTLGKAIMLLENITDGSVSYNIGGEYRNIQSFNRKELFLFRKRIQMIFQDPYSALNPMKKIYTALEEPLLIHGVKNKSEREKIMEEVLKSVNIPIDYIYKYPHEFSGGQRQRLCIARVLQVRPEVIVCDEIVSALDVSIQAQVLNLMKRIQRERLLTYVFIAHDLSVVQYMSDRIAVMYLGSIVELADTKELCSHILHPYTESLFSAIPIPVLGRKKNRIILKGDVPSPITKPSGCAFHERCAHCMEICKKTAPTLSPYKDSSHLVACHLYDTDVQKEKNNGIRQ